MIDLTKRLQEVRKRSDQWSTIYFSEVWEKLKIAFPELFFELDQGAGERWGSVLAQDEVAAIVRIAEPIAIIFDAIRPGMREMIESASYVILQAPHWDSPIFNIDLLAVKHLFPDWPLNALVETPDMNIVNPLEIETGIENTHLLAISARDLWWATIT